MRSLRREKIMYRFFLFFISYASKLYKIWGEIGKKLGGKNINKNIVIDS